MEIWRDILNYEGSYQISSQGRVKSLRRFRCPENRILLGSPDDNGYLKVALCKAKTPKYFRIHRLVATAFIPNSENKRCVNHRDGNKRNNNATNLVWSTDSENELHSYITLRKRAPRAKLTMEDVKEIRRLYPSLTEIALAKRYGVRQTTISSIVNRVNWRSI